MHWQRHKHGRAHADAWGAKIPVAVAIGTEPALTYAATAPLPPMLDEFAFAGLAARKAGRTRAARRRSICYVPAEAEFVLEGYVDNDDLRVEGPFGDHTGVYSPADRYPTFHVDVHHASARSRSTRRPSSASRRWKTRGSERRPNASSCRCLQAMLPEVVDMNLPVEGGFHNLAIVSIRKSYPGQAKKVMNALWGLGHMMMLTRVLIVVDADVDVQDPRSVAWFVLNNLGARARRRDDARSRRRSRSRLVQRRYGTKIGIDATRKDASEGYAREWPPDMIMDDATRRLVTRALARVRPRRASSARCSSDDWSGQGPRRVRPR